MKDQERSRGNCAVPASNLEVQVRTGCAPGLANCADPLRAKYNITFRDVSRGQVRVVARESEKMSENNDLAVARVILFQFYAAASRCHDPCTDGRREVYTPVKLHIQHDRGLRVSTKEKVRRDDPLDGIAKGRDQNEQKNEPRGDQKQSAAPSSGKERGCPRAGAHTRALLRPSEGPESFVNLLQLWEVVRRGCHGKSLLARILDQIYPEEYRKKQGVRMSIRHVVVTGSEGKAGRYTVAQLSSQGYEVLRVDAVAPLDPADHGVRRADLTDLGQTVEVLRGADAVVHLAAIPAPFMITDAETFRINTISTYNVFSAAATLGLSRVVWASSETALGLPFDRHPDYAPVDEEHTYPEYSYALSKVVSEEMARQFSRWTGMTLIGLRLSNIILPEAYAEFPNFRKDAASRKWNLWGYVDVRDVAQSCRRGLEAELEGAHHYVIAAADTVMDRPSIDLMKEYYPEVPIRKDLDTYETLLCIDRARKELGYEPQHSWRTQ